MRTGSSSDCRRRPHPALLKALPGTYTAAGDTDGPTSRACASGFTAHGGVPRNRGARTGLSEPPPPPHPTSSSARTPAPWLERTATRDRGHCGDPRGPARPRASPGPRPRASGRSPVPSAGSQRRSSGPALVRAGKAALAAAGAQGPALKPHQEQRRMDPLLGSAEKTGGRK